MKRGHGSFITLEFGSPSLVVREPIEASEKSSEETKKALRRRRISIVGDYHLWIYCCRWELKHDNTIIATNDARNASIDKACAELDGRLLKGVVPDDYSSGIKCDFEDDLTLHTSPDPTLEADQWLLYHPDQVYTLSYKGLLDYETRIT